MTESKYTKEEIERLWVWIDRILPEEFFETAGHLGNDGLRRQRWLEIPEELKPTARMLIEVASYRHKKGIRPDDDYSCLSYRIMVHEAYEKMKENGNELFLPHAWFTDGVMINPEWMVRLTNGLIGYVCDAGSNICGMEDECRYWRKSKYEDGMPPINQRVFPKEKK